MSQTKNIILIGCLSLLTFAANCCTIVSCARNGRAYAAGNEDDYTNTLYPRIWFNPPTKERYGTVCFGFADLQAQTIMNEYGLFVDFTMQVSIVPSELKIKNSYPGDVWFEILGHCKTVKEVLDFLKPYDYGYNGQALLADANGNSIIINAEGSVSGNTDYQINTNFNILELGKGKADSRYKMADDILAKRDDVSINYLKMLLDRTHQEGDLTTIYSYIFDMKSGRIHVYYYHNYTFEYVIDIKKELQKGYRLENLTDYFPKTYAFETVAPKNQELEKEMILSEIKKDGLDVVVNQYLSRLDTMTTPAVALYFSMLEVALQLVKNSWNAHAEGGVWEYWFNFPGGYKVNRFYDVRLVAAELIFRKLAARPGTDIKMKNFITEIIAYLRLIDGDQASAIRLYQTVWRSKDECYPITYERATAMLRTLR